MSILNKKVIIALGRLMAKPFAQQIEKLGKNSEGIIGKSMIKGGHKIYYYYNILYRKTQGKETKGYKPQKIPDHRAKSFFNYFLLEVLFAYIYIGGRTAQGAINFYWERKHDLQKREQVEGDLKTNTKNLEKIYEYLDKQEKAADIQGQIEDELQKCQRNYERLQQIYETQQQLNL